jgi:tetratricopeptide (TPR) repeat protein
MSKYFCQIVVAFSLFTSIFFSCLPPSQAQDKPPIEDKKQLEARAKQTAEEAKAFEAKGQLKEAEEKYLAAEAIITTREGSGGLDRVRRAKAKRAQSLLTESHGLYDAGKTQEAISKLEEANLLEPGNAATHYNLALGYTKLDDKAKAISELDQCLQILPEDNKNRSQIEQMKSALVTGEKTPQLTGEQKAKIDGFNVLALAQTRASSGIAEAETPKPQSKDSKPPIVPCSQLKDLESTLPKSPALYFNLAKCAEEDGRQDDALRYLNQYLSAAPAALDSDDVRLRVANNTSLTKLTGPAGEQVRKLYAEAAREIDQRKYDRAIEDFAKAEQVIPDYSMTKWRLALLYEAEGNVPKARQHYASYLSLETSDTGIKEAAAHLENLEKDRAQYDSSVQDARTIITPLLLRSMNLDSEGWSGKQYSGGAMAMGMVLGRTPAATGANNMSYAYIREKIDDARKKLDVAASIFPLGPEVNELLAFTYMQGNNPAAAMRCYDIVMSEHLPVSFYGTAFTAHDKRTVRDVKVELVRDDVRLIYLSSYDPKKKKFEPPVKPAGADALGNFTIAKPDDTAKGTDDASWKTTDLKGIETKNNYVALNTGSDEVFIGPLSIASETPIQGIPARKFGNTYSRLFLRYMGYDNTKLGTEHMSGGEKFSLGMNIAAAGMGGYSAFAGGGAMMTTRLMVSMYAMNSAMSALRKSRADQRQLIEGNDFRIIPSQSFDLAFREKFL